VLWLTLILWDMTEPEPLSTDSSFRGLESRVVLNDGSRMPWLGLGAYQMGSDKETTERVARAIDLGYRCVDTAALYGNERGVGQAISRSGVPREQLFVTTKVWNDDVRRNRVQAAFDESLRRLGLDYVDLYLVHWPISGKVVEAWQALERIKASGRAKAIGVSNHMVPHLKELLAVAEIVPAVNQVEFHPYLQSRDLFKFCTAKQIQLQAWGPLMQGGDILKDRSLSAIARVHGKTVAQIILRWDLQSGVSTIPKSASPARLAENSAIFDFVLSDVEMSAINALDRNQRSGADPFDFGF
jgi:diketogulonate reductase-like aldo/keto reductase